MRKKEEGQHLVRDVATRQKQEEKAREKELEEGEEEGVLDKDELLGHSEGTEEEGKH